MGPLDFLLSKRMKQRKAAIEIGLESGLFVSCPICHDITEAPDPSAHRPDTESLIRQLVRRHDPRASLFDYAELEIMQMVNLVGRDLPYRCRCHSI